MPRIQKTSALMSIALDLIAENYHRPIKDKKCNRESIGDAIFEMVYMGIIPPMNHLDVEYVCDTIDVVIEEFSSSDDPLGEKYGDNEIKKSQDGSDIIGDPSSNPITDWDIGFGHHR